MDVDLDPDRAGEDAVEGEGPGRGEHGDDATEANSRRWLRTSAKSLCPRWGESVAAAALGPVDDRRPPTHSAAAPRSSSPTASPPPAGEILARNARSRQRRDRPIVARDGATPRLRRGQGRPRRRRASAPSGRSSRSTRASSGGCAASPPPGWPSAATACRATPRSASTPSASSSTATASRRVRAHPRRVLARRRGSPITASDGGLRRLSRARAGSRRPTGSERRCSGEMPEPVDRRAVLGGRVADVLLEAPARVALGGARACSGRGSPWRSPRRRRSRRWCASPPTTAPVRRPRSGAARSRRPGRSSPRPAPSRSSASRERFDVGHVQAAAVDPGRRADHDADPRRRPQHAGEHLQPPLLGHLLGVVQAAEGAAVGVREALVVDQDRGGDQRAGQAAAPGLVGAGDEAALQPAVEGEQAAAAGQPAPVAASA